MEWLQATVFDIESHRRCCLDSLLLHKDVTTSYLQPSTFSEKTATLAGICVGVSHDRCRRGELAPSSNDRCCGGLAPSSRPPHLASSPDYQSQLTPATVGPPAFGATDQAPADKQQLHHHQQQQQHSNEMDEEAMAYLLGERTDDNIMVGIDRNFFSVGDMDLMVTDEDQTPVKYSDPLQRQSKDGMDTKCVFSDITMNDNENMDVHSPLTDVIDPNALTILKNYILPSDENLNVLCKNTELFNPTGTFSTFNNLNSDHNRCAEFVDPYTSSIFHNNNNLISNKYYQHISQCNERQCLRNVSCKHNIDSQCRVLEPKESNNSNISIPNLSTHAIKEPNIDIIKEDSQSLSDCQQSTKMPIYNHSNEYYRLSSNSANRYNIKSTGDPLVSGNQYINNSKVCSNQSEILSQTNHIQDSASKIKCKNSNDIKYYRSYENRIVTSNGNYDIPIQQHSSVSSNKKDSNNYQFTESDIENSNANNNFDISVTFSDPITSESVHVKVPFSYTKNTDKQDLKIPSVNTVTLSNRTENTMQNSQKDRTVVKRLVNNVLCDLKHEIPNLVNNKVINSLPNIYDQSKIKSNQFSFEKKKRKRNLKEPSKSSISSRTSPKNKNENEVDKCNSDVDDPLMNENNTNVDDQLNRLFNSIDEANKTGSIKTISADADFNNFAINNFGKRGQRRDREAIEELRSLQPRPKKHRPLSRKIELPRLNDEMVGVTLNQDKLDNDCFREFFTVEWRVVNGENHKTTGFLVGVDTVWETYKSFQADFNARHESKNDLSKQCFGKLVRKIGIQKIKRNGSKEQYYYYAPIEDIPGSKYAHEVMEKERK
ncbi:unnamed protein product, partial [Meganyctiphanes norvegica]